MLTLRYSSLIVLYLKKHLKFLFHLKLNFVVFLISRGCTKSGSVNKLYFNPFSSIKFKTGSQEFRILYESTKVEQKISLLGTLPIKI